MAQGHHRATSHQGNNMGPSLRLGFISIIYLGAIASYYGVDAKVVDITGTVKLKGIQDANGEPVVGEIHLQFDADLGSNKGTGGEVRVAGCEPLISKLNNFVLNDAWDEMGPLFDLNGLGESAADFWYIVQEQTGFDLRNGAVRERLSCLIIAADEGDKMALKEIEPLVKVYGHFEVELNYMIEMFSYEGLLQTLGAIAEFSHWRNTTGFPQLPLRTSEPREEVLSRFQAWYDVLKTLNAGPAGDLMGDYVYFPVSVTPEEAVEAIYSSTSTTELMEKLDLNEGFYNTAMDFAPPLSLEAGANLCIQFLEIIRGWLI